LSGTKRPTRLAACAAVFGLAHTLALAAPPTIVSGDSDPMPGPVVVATVATVQAAPLPQAGAAAGTPAPDAGIVPPAPSAPAATPAGAEAASAAGAPPAPAVDAAAANAPAAQNAAPATDADLWERIRRGFKMPDLDTKRAQSSTRWYAGQPDYIARMAGRAGMYLFHIVEEIEKRGMPTELALLPFVESAMQPEAVSFAKAAGLWQFIPSTGRLYSLEQNVWKDERFGVIESTRAALDYLQNLYAEFGDWQLALAAYNCGEAGVERALARARKAHRSLAYKDLRLPNETQFYVPKLQAIKNIIADPARFGIALPNIRNEPYFVAVTKTPDIDVATAARLAEMPLEDFRALNPAFNRPLIVGASSPTILVPADRADDFEANLAAWQATGQPLASWTAYTLQSGEVLSKVAERVGITEAQLREANRIPARYRPAPGSTILIPRDETMSDDIAPGFVEASFSLVPESSNLRQVTYRVRRGDTLASVARRWHVSPDDIVSWNQLRSMSLFTGQRLSLTVARPAAPTVHHPAKKRASPAASKTVAAAAHPAPNAHAAIQAAAASAPARL
jgi:membrane-bound lytic murein transglycosylase D